MLRPLLILLVLATPAAHAEAGPDEVWSLHGQATTVSQGHPGFTAAYTGVNSLQAYPEFDTSFTATLFLGRKLWSGGELYFNPEVTAGQGVSQTHGVAGFPNGEIYRVETPAPRINLARLYLKQVFALGEDRERIDADKDQLRAQYAVRRLTVVAGRFSLNDFFDDNLYSHDPRTQFLNWALMDNGAWDYAADTRGYTWGIYAELHAEDWSLRFASVLEPKEANGLDFDLDVAQAHGDQVELEHRHKICALPGAFRLLGYWNHAHMGSYAETLANPAYNLDITQTRAYRVKWGLGFNLEQELGPGLGVFSRLGWNNGTTETWAFTEIDRTISAGISLKGAAWQRPEDVVGLALIVNGLSPEHADYLAAGGYGFLIGDGTLSYAPEQILETYYSFLAFPGFAVTADYQFVNHPAYNADRGPAHFFAGRLHYEF